MEKKRFAVLLCAEDSEYVKINYGGYFGVFVAMLAEEDEIWDVYKVAEGELPASDELIGAYDGFVITGSCNDADGNATWISNLLEFVQKLNSMKKKILGICFGHQILGRALGGKIGRSETGWDIGVRTLHLSSNIFSSLSILKALSIIECHQDEVIELPSTAEVIASSNKTRIEMFRYGDHIMGIQGHPEYNDDILLHLITRLLHRNLIEDSLADQTKAKLQEMQAHVDKEAWKQICVGFLKGRLRMEESLI